jgi:hypothetical protein
MVKIELENVGEGLSVPAFYIAYRELGQKYGLFGKTLNELADFLNNLSGRNLRRIFVAFGLRVIVHDERVSFHVGGDAGLLVAERDIPPDARRPDEPAVDAHFLDDSAVAAVVGLYADPDSVKRHVVEFCMVQPLEVCFPYGGKKQWHEAAILRIVAENVVAAKLGLPEVAPPELSSQVADLLANQLGFDIEKWAETRARNIRQGIEPEPDFFAYKKVDEENEP